jgi:hypothetical protein
MFSRALLTSAGLHAWSRVCTFLGERELARLAPSVCELPYGSTLRVALVKQSTYSDLYTAPAAPDALALLRSSWHRTGPIGLFTEFNTRFFIVHPEPDPECRVWEEKKTYWRGNPKREADDRARHAAQERVALRAAEVDWSAFDLVIAIENAVPAAVTRCHPGVLWATLLEHHRMRDYARSLREPPPGYDLFFNLRYGPNPRSWHRRPHVIDWPYNYTRPGVLPKLFGRPPRTPAPPSVLIEDNQDHALVCALQDAGVRVCQGAKATLAEYLETLLSADALLFPSPRRPLGGLAMMDAASADLALIGDPRQLWNPYLLTPAAAAATARATVAVLQNLNRHPEIRATLLAEQRRRLDWFVGVRPWLQIQAAASQVPRPLSILAPSL